MERLFRNVVETPVGFMTLVVSERGLRETRFGNWAGPEGIEESEHKTAAVRRQLDEYFAGKRREFTLSLDWRGTPFQQSVWKELVRIPFGETRSYGDVARAIGHPAAFRAVGGANGSNPIPIIVPCHRVIGSSGALTGYSGRGGLPIKAKLLALEGALPEPLFKNGH